MDLVRKNEEEADDNNNIKNNQTIKKLKPDDSDLEGFLAWCKSSDVFIDTDKVQVTRSNTSHNYGMVAVKDIESGEVLAKISKTAILQPNTTSIKDLIKKNSKSLRSESSWSKLVISIMAELSKPDSKWSWYLKVFPNYDMLDLPMFWSEETFSTLANTCIHSNIKQDLIKMRTEFDDTILPFVKSNKSLFTEECLTFEYYKKVVAFIMSYSFRDPNEDPDDSKSIGPMMVPVADILNHIAKNNAQLEFGKSELIISSTKAIRAGEEVFNTYGEHSNTDILHMYGFVEHLGENDFDSVEISTECFEAAYKRYNNNTDELMAKKVEVLKELDMIDDSMAFIIGADGILNEEECLHMLQIYSMTKDEFMEFCDNDFELLEDEEWDNYSLLNDKVASLPIEWKHFLNECCESHLNALKSDKHSLDAKLQSSESSQMNGTTLVRFKKVQVLLEGHINLLTGFIKSMKI